MVAKAKARVRNEAGIHCRPSAHIVKQLAGYSGSMRVIHGEEGESDLRSMLSLMMLALTHETEVEVEVEGPNEETQLQKIVELLEYEYDFPQES